MFPGLRSLSLQLAQMGSANINDRSQKVSPFALPNST